jgi:hypothetical protein
MTVEVTSYTEMIAAIAARAAVLGIKQADFDVLASFPAGLWGKVAGPSQVKRLGPEKLFDALRAAGLRIRVEEDPEQAEKMRKRIAENFNPRQANQARPNNSASPISAAVLSRCFKHLSRKGGVERWRGKSKEERSEHMRMMAMAGVKKRRREMKRRARQRKAAHKARKVASA